MKKLMSLLITLTLCFTMFVPTPAVSNEVVITVDDSECTFTGLWKTSTSSAVLGPTGGYSRNTSDRNAMVSYSAAGLEPGFYDVYTWIIAYAPSRTDDIEVAIAHNCETWAKDTGITHINLLSYPDNTRIWEYLGTYQFDGIEGEYVSFQIDETSRQASAQRAAAVKFVPSTATAEPEHDGIVIPPIPPIEYKTIVDGEEWIMGCDDQKFESTGLWKESSLLLPGYNTGYYTSEIGSTATWYPHLTAVAGVDVWYLKIRATESEDPGLQVDVYSGGETTTKIIDCTEGETEWVHLGKYNFSGDGSEYVKVTKVSETGTTRSTIVKFSLGVDPKIETPDSTLAGTDLEILERLGMLTGDGITEEYLASTPTRADATVLFLKLFGLYEEASAFAGTDNYSDVNDALWAAPYMSYIKAHPEFGITGENESNNFKPSKPMDQRDYVKALLFNLGYICGEDYNWGQTSNFASSLGLTTEGESKFTIEELAKATGKALNIKMKGSETLTLLGSIITKREGINDTDYSQYTFTKEMRDARTEEKNKERGLIYNNDGNDTYVTYDNYPGPFDVSTVKEPMTHENFLSKRTTGVDNTQVTSIFYCDGVFDSYTHRSSGETEVRHRDWSWTLADIGMDPLETIIDYGDKNDMEVFWSMRMNDTHDMAYQENQLDGWKRANMDLLMGKKDQAAFMPYGGARWSAVDYGYKEVRQKVYNTLKDVVVRYDVDGIELDFTRHLTYFKEVALGKKIYPENIQRMNNLIRSLRLMTEKVSMERGKPILISIYIPDSIDYCYEVGLDIRTWMKEDLIDIVTAGSTIRFQSWQDTAKEYSEFDVPIYAAFDSNSYTKGTDYYKEVAMAWAANVDGIYVYNMFNPNSEYFKKFGSSETVGPYDQNYVSTARTTGAGSYVKGGEQYVKDLNP